MFNLPLVFYQYDIYLGVLHLIPTPPFPPFNKLSVLAKICHIIV